MCLGVPMLVVEVTGFVARCEARGVNRDASLWLVQHESIAPGDHVMVHGGNVLQKITAEEAEASWAVIDEMLAEESRRSVGSAQTRILDQTS